METHRVRAVVRGRVQGVGYRASTQHEGRKLGLSGWVRNLPDGSVELEAEGPRPAVEALLAWCARGPLGARVDDVETRWLSAAEHAAGATAHAAPGTSSASSPGGEGFHIRR